MESTTTNGLKFLESLRNAKDKQYVFTCLLDERGADRTAVAVRLQQTSSNFPSAYDDLRIPPPDDSLTIHRIQR